MKDRNGNTVKIGDLVRVLEIYDGFLQPLPEDERILHEAMLDNIYAIDDIVEDGTKASVSFEHKTSEGIYFGGLYMLPHEFILVKSSESNQHT